MPEKATGDRAAPGEIIERQKTSVLGGHYHHLVLADGSDLYITRHGAPFVRQLMPENYWTDRDWFTAHSIRLHGTSMLYRIQTKRAGGRSKSIVLKWNRMGQDVPGDTRARDLSGAEFNSPFEEFGLVNELRSAGEKAHPRVYTQKPLAIYVPRKYVETERLGRKPYKIRAMQKSHSEVTLHPNRKYAVIYEWVKGIDATRALRAGMISENGVRDLVSRSEEEMARCGFRVRDNKAHHIIVRPTRTGRLAGDGSGELLYAMVDFELLERTPQREKSVRAQRRKKYLVKQAHRFESAESLPRGLNSHRLMGVDYVFGHVESTGGALWVVGKDPSLFEYFLPEKWRKTARNVLPASGKVYDTVTKDDVHLVWRVSRVGHKPVPSPETDEPQRAISHGYNSPFEEVSLSMRLARAGVETAYPRAIYMTGHKAEKPEHAPDPGRYRTHRGLVAPDDHPVLSQTHDYITLWGYWNGPDELLAARDREYFRSVDAASALERDLVGREVYERMLRAFRERLIERGFEDLNLNGSHLLLSVDRRGQLASGRDGLPAMRICNFELLRPARSRRKGSPTPHGTE